MLQLVSHVTCTPQAHTHLISAPLDRAKSLVALYTLEEKINATSSGSPGVLRLGIPPYQWWSEGLHGIAGPYTNFSSEGEYSYSTSFPQPILMGAAFDDALITEVAKVISTEARAFNNANRTGLDFWTPVSSGFFEIRLPPGTDTVLPEHQPVPRPSLGTRSRNPRRGFLSSVFICQGADSRASRG